MTKTMKNAIQRSAAPSLRLPRQKLLAVCVGALFLPCGAALAQSSFGNSAIGADTALGNSLNPPGRSNIAQADEDDSYDTVRHTPSGQLYGIPIDRSADLQSQTADGLLYSGSVEIGFLGGSPEGKYSKYREYRDPKKGFGLNWFDFQLEKPDAAFYVNGYGGNPGQNDQFYDLQMGRYNDWRVRAFYSEIPHVFSNTFRSLYVNAGGNHLVANPAYFPSATTNYANAAAMNTVPAVDEVGLVRKRMGLRGDLTTVDAWRFFVTATTEKREGERPYGFMNMGEGYEPINQRTSDFSIGLQYFQGKTAANLRASLSIFENDKDTLFVDSLGAVNRNGVYPTNAVANIYTFRYSMPPDNKNVSIKGDAKHEWDFWNTRLTGGFSWGSSTNDSRLNMPLQPGWLAYGTTIPGGAANVNNFQPTTPATLSQQWDGTLGCPMMRCNSDLRIDTSMFNLGLSTEPVDSLTLRAGARYLANENKSGKWFSWNPLTTGGNTLNGYMAFAGFFNGVGAANSFGVNGLGVLQNNGSMVGFARTDRTINYTLSGEYLFGKAQSVDLSYERENLHYTYRERDETHEDKFKLTYTGRNFFDNLTLRGSYEYDRKRGSFYDVLQGTGRALVSFMELNGIPYSRANLNRLMNGSLILPGLTTAQFNTALGNWIGANANFNPGGGLFQKMDITDRNQNVLNGRIGYSPREDIDLGVSMQLARVEYPGNQIGVTQSNQSSFNLDANWQPSAATQIGAWYSVQYNKDTSYENYGPVTNAAGLTTACGALTTASLDCWWNNTRNVANNVKVKTETKTDAFGVTLTHDFNWARLGVSYNYTRSNTSIVHAYANGPVNTALNAANPNAPLGYNVTGDYPDMVTTIDSLEVNLVKDFTKQLTGRLMYRVDAFHSKDWHYDYLAAPQSGYYAADMGPQNFRIQAVGAFLQYKF